MPSQFSLLRARRWACDSRLGNSLPGTRAQRARGSPGANSQSSGSGLGGKKARS